MRVRGKREINTEDGEELWVHIEIIALTKQRRTETCGEHFSLFNTFL